MAVSTTEEATCRFIQLFDEHPNLYDTRSSQYHDRNMAMESYIKIAREMGMRVEEVKKKIKNLRTQYCAQLTKWQQSKKSGASGEEVKVPTWKFFQLLEFLHPFVVTRKGRDNMEDYTASQERPQSQSLSDSQQLDYDTDSLVSDSHSLYNDSFCSRDVANSYDGFVEDEEEVEEEEEYQQQQGDLGLLMKQVGVQPGRPIRPLSASHSQSAQLRPMTTASAAGISHSQPQLVSPARRPQHNLTHPPQSQFVTPSPSPKRTRLSPQLPPQNAPINRKRKPDPVESAVSVLHAIANRKQFEPAPKHETTKVEHFFKVLTMEVAALPNYVMISVYSNYVPNLCCCQY